MDFLYNYNVVFHSNIIANESLQRLLALKKRNLVQFRNSTGKTIATLRDPRNPNDANVTLSRSDDLKRYLNELRHLSLTFTKIPDLKIGNIGKSGSTDDKPSKRRKASFVQKQKRGWKRDDLDSYITKLEKISKEGKKKAPLKHEKEIDFMSNRFPSFYDHLNNGEGSFKSGNLIIFFVFDKTGFIACFLKTQGKSRKRLELTYLLNFNFYWIFIVIVVDFLD